MPISQWNTALAAVSLSLKCSIISVIMYFILNSLMVITLPRSYIIVSYFAQQLIWQWIQTNFTPFTWASLNSVFLHLYAASVLLSRLSCINKWMIRHPCLWLEGRLDKKIIKSVSCCAIYFLLLHWPGWLVFMWPPLSSKLILLMWYLTRTSKVAKKIHWRWSTALT